MDPQVRAAQMQKATQRLNASLQMLCACVGIEFDIQAIQVADREVRELRIQEAMANLMKPVAEAVEAMAAGAPKPTKLTRALDSQNANLERENGELKAAISDLEKKVAELNLKIENARGAIA